MTGTHAYDEEQIGRLIGLLSPAPAGWVRAAQEIPVFRRTLDEIVARAEADAAFRAELIADLEAALLASGYEPEPRVVEAVRREIADADES